MTKLSAGNTARKVIVATVVGAACMVALGCHRAERPRPEGKAEPVQAAPVSERSLPSAEDFVGNVQSRQAVLISTKMMGRVLKIDVEEGQEVKRGQPLLEVDAAEAQSAYAQSKAGLDAADVALRNAERDEARFKALYEQKAVTKHQLEQVEMGLAAAKAQKAQAEANLKMSGTLLSYGRILAPDAGIITKKWMDAGNLAYPGAPILTLENPKDLEVSVAVPEGKARLLAAGQRAQVSLESAPGDQSIDVPVTAVVAAADPMSRTSTVKLSLPDDRGLRPGQFVHVRFDALAAKGLAVPADALITEGQMEGVFVVENGTARLRWIQTGQRTGGLVQVLSGLQAGERVITPVPDGLTDGTPVEVRP